MQLDALIFELIYDNVFTVEDLHILQHNYTDTTHKLLYTIQYLRLSQFYSNLQLIQHSTQLPSLQHHSIKKSTSRDCYQLLYNKVKEIDQLNVPLKIKHKLNYECNLPPVPPFNSDLCNEIYVNVQECITDYNIASKQYCDASTNTITVKYKLAKQQQNKVNEKTFELVKQLEAMLPSKYHSYLK